MDACIHKRNNWREFPREATIGQTHWVSWWPYHLLPAWSKGLVLPYIWSGCVFSFTKKYFSMFFCSMSSLRISFWLQCPFLTFYSLSKMWCFAFLFYLRPPFRLKRVFVILSEPFVHLTLCLSLHCRICMWVQKSCSTSSTLSSRMLTSTPSITWSGTATASRTPTSRSSSPSSGDPPRHTSTKSGPRSPRPTAETRGRWPTTRSSE